jgi:hypothetical protein
MPLVPLDIPAGVVRHGTDSESAGRWRDVNFVRWENGSLRPIGGWRPREERSADGSLTTHVTLGTNKAARAAISWLGNAGTAYLAAGTHDTLFYINESGTVSTLVSAIAGATENAEENIGYGQYYYGKGLYGVERPSDGVVGEGDTWSLSAWGQNLIAVNTHEGVLREWNPANNTANAIVASSGTVPAGVKAVVVTEERFLFALGNTANSRQVRWCDREDNTVWGVAATNEAGDIELDTTGDIQLGLQVRGRTLILTTTDAHAATYSGPPVVFGFEKVGSGCGAISRHCAVAMDQGAMWMGYGSFFFYNGQGVQEMPCDVQDYVFKGMNDEQRSKIYAVKNQLFNEVWWFYPSSSSTECDRYVVYDYKEQHWNIGQLDRTAGVDVGVFRKPIWFAADGKLYEHETGYEHTLTVDGDVVIPYAETGPIEAGTGDNVINITKVIPDHKATGEYHLVFKTRNYPNSEETSKGPFDALSPTNVRFQGRQVRMRIDPSKRTLNRNLTGDDYNSTAVVIGIHSASVGIPNIFNSVIINGRALGDIEGDGAVTSRDSFEYNRYAAGLGSDEVRAYCENVIDAYILANYPDTKEFFEVEVNKEDWTLGTVKLETKLGGTR